VEIYKKDHDIAKANLESLENLHESKLKEFYEEKNKLRTELSDAKNEYAAKVDSISENYENFKNDFGKELDIRFVINKRQSDFIEILKKELKTAKMIIETPRMGAKYLNKISYRNNSIGATIEETKTLGKKIVSKGLNRRSSLFNSSFSTSASPIYSNASELDINLSNKLIGLIPEIKHY